FLVTFVSYKLLTSANQQTHQPSWLKLKRKLKRERGREVFSVTNVHCDVGEGRRAHSVSPRGLKADAPVVLLLLCVYVCVCVCVCVCSTRACVGTHECVCVYVYVCVQM